MGAAREGMFQKGALSQAVGWGGSGALGENPQHSHPPHTHTQALVPAPPLSVCLLAPSLGPGLCLRLQLFHLCGSPFVPLRLCLYLSLFSRFLYQCLYFPLCGSPPSFSPSGVSLSSSLILSLSLDLCPSVSDSLCSTFLWLLSSLSLSFSSSSSFLPHYPPA